MEVDFYIKNRVAEQEFEKIAYTWLAQGDYTPDDILENIISEKDLLQLPLYFYRKEYYGNCSASLGFEEEQYYREWDDFNKKYVEKSRWVTRWQAFSQDVFGEVSVVVYGEPTKYTQITNFIEAIQWKGEDLNQLEYDNPNYPIFINSFKFSARERWEDRGVYIANEIVKRKVSNELPSRNVRNLSVNVGFSDKRSFSLIAPFWIYFYDYNGERHFLIVDGSNPNRIDGTRPVDTESKEGISNIRWVCWFVGVALTCYVSFYLSGKYLKEFDEFWKMVICFISGIFFTWAFTEDTVNKAKNKSLKIRQKKLEKILSK